MNAIERQDEYRCAYLQFTVEFTVEKDDGSRCMIGNSLGCVDEVHLTSFVF